MQHSLPRAEAQNRTTVATILLCTEVAPSVRIAKLPLRPRHLLLNSFIARDPPKTPKGFPVPEPKAATRHRRFMPPRNTPSARAHLSAERCPASNAAAATAINQALNSIPCLQNNPPSPGQSARSKKVSDPMTSASLDWANPSGKKKCRYNAVKKKPQTPREQPTRGQ